jgi:hypothetical protein
MPRCRRAVRGENFVECIFAQQAPGQNPKRIRSRKPSGAEVVLIAT